ncbi:MAG: hypothetical protein ABUT20_46760, partial [Bacteroidota bacterium]
IYYSDFAKADMNEIFGEKLKAAKQYEASQMSSLILENTGKGFIIHTLPAEAQWYPVYSITIMDVNGDNKKDLILGGNQSYSRIKFGAYSCGKGDIFINKNNFHFERLSPAESGIRISGDIRNAVVTGNQLIFGINNQQPVHYSLR